MKTDAKQEYTTRLAERVASMENVVTAANLAVAAFRMKNERALVETLRLLAEAVDAMNTQGGAES